MPTRRTFDKAEFLPNDNSTPHIVPDVLYPAIGGKLLDGTTSHSGDYGTAQSSDSRKYYYTDIKGSKPIRDPRIGAYFGSQRHMFKSIQFLEQETATHGKNVYSIDGREWMRVVGDVTYVNDQHGIQVKLESATTSFFEITGYFNFFNFLNFTSDSVRNLKIEIDGTTAQATFNPNGSVNSTLGNRYVSAASVLNVDISSATSTLGIHTIRISWVSSVNYPQGCELIAQDTTNAVTRNKIQIPSQTVFSFGSKFTVGGSSAARHYDPFSAKSDGTGWTSPTSGTNTPNSSAAWPSNIDTATSLGLVNWVDGTNYYRPYNGGRVVNWVDENGEIKTSVTVMPPNAKSFANSGTLSNATAKSNGSAPNDNFRPTFEAHTSSIDEDLLSEVTKTFYFREFGNGSANGNASYADASMLTTSADNAAYVMDDGLTTFNGHDQRGSGDVVYADSRTWYMTFIGTGLRLRHNELNGRSANFILDGVTIHSGTYSSEPDYNKVQNLPYGTHILKYDGQSNYHAFYEASYYQPKMPPIPEGACIIADYMFMADFIPQTSREVDKISKGVRRINSSRDIFYDTNSGGISFEQAATYAVTEEFGFDIAIQNGTRFFQLPYFGTGNIVHFRGNSSDRATEITYSINGNAVTDANFSGISRLAASSSGITFDTDGTYGQNVGSQVHNFAGVKGGISLGLNTIKNQATESSKYLSIDGIDVATPIHTSHHYKSFETPFLHELIGGDRNMEQTHLICSADGKTWDEVTRDTSYLSDVCIVASRDGGDFTSAQTYKYDLFRGTFHVHEGTQKNFAIGYDRFICLVGGYYKVTTNNYSADQNKQIQVMKNSVSDDNSKTIAFGRTDPQDHTIALTGNVHLKRGDYIGVYIDGGTFRGSNVVYTFISIEKLNK